MSRPIDFPCKGCGALAGQPCHKPSGVKTRAHAERRQLAVPEVAIEETKFNTQAEAEAFLRGVHYALLARLVSPVPMGTKRKDDQFLALVRVNRS